MIKEQLTNELKRISKGQWAGLPYSSYHHPKFTIEGAKAPNAVCQRDTKDRFEKLGITKEMVEGKTILDLGSNSGAMLAYASQLGAKRVIGVDNYKPNIDFCIKLFHYLNYHDQYFYHKDVNKLNSLREFKPDVIFCFALSKWANYDHLIKLLSESGTELIVFEDNKNMGRIIKDIIPNYDCKFVWKSGPEGNSPIGHPGWGRMSYICKKKENELITQINNGSFYDEYYFNDNIKSNYGSYTEYPAFKDLAKKIYSLFIPKRILGVGCAKGFMIKWWKRFGAIAYGVDISKWAIDNAPDEIKDCMFQGDIRNIKFPNQFFDIVTCFETLEHISGESIDKAISELYRVCNDICLVSMPTSINPNEKDLSHISIYPDEFWITKFKNTGFNFLGKKEMFDLDKVKKSEEEGYWTTNNIFIFGVRK